MARYTITDPKGDFAGWDELSLDAIVTEATHERHLGKTMPENVLGVFDGLKTGQRQTHNDYSFFREW